MTDITTLQSQRTTLASARASGALIVTYSDGASIRYRDDAELVAQIASVDRQILEMQGAPPVRTILFTTSKG